MFVTSIYTCSDPAVYVSVETCRVVRRQEKKVWITYGGSGVGEGRG